MEIKTLGNIISSLSPGYGFYVSGEVNDENDYNNNVVFSESSYKPTWSAVQGAKGIEQWVVIRGQRGLKLRVCDWTQLADVPLAEAKKTAWQTYRTALRDITTQSDPFNINWPSPPE